MDKSCRVHDRRHSFKPRHMLCSRVRTRLDKWLFHCWHRERRSWIVTLPSRWCVVGLCASIFLLLMSNIWWQASGYWKRVIAFPSPFYVLSLHKYTSDPSSWQRGCIRMQLLLLAGTQHFMPGVTQSAFTALSHEMSTEPADSTNMPEFQAPAVVVNPCRAFTLLAYRLCTVCLPAGQWDRKKPARSSIIRHVGWILQFIHNADKLQVQKQ